MSELMTYKPMTADIGIETILGFDSRVQTYPNTFPRRAVGLITFNPPGGASRCTGWLIGKDTVATAGHCVAEGGSKQFYNKATYKFFPAKNGASQPYGFCTAKNLYTDVEWFNNGSDDYDYGLIKLNCTVGNNTGWFGFFWTAGNLLNEPTVISGYPGDKPLTQWESVDKVRVNEVRRTFYKNDTIGGMSGSPVWSDRPPGAPFAQNGAYGMAVHAYGTYNGAPFNTHNHGTRITQRVFNNFVFVKNLP
jgi:glutamyl endopeptidase